jgi:hypothetical protein
MPNVIWLLLLTITSSLLKKFNIFNRLFKTEPNQKKTLRYIFGFFTLMSTLVVSAIIADSITPYINDILNQLYDKYTG